MDVCIVNTIVLHFLSMGGSHAKEILRIVYTNLCGPMAKTSHGGAKYFITFIDDLFKKTIFLYHED